MKSNVINKDYIFETSLDYIKKSNNLIEKINALMGKNQNIPNIAITFNNKLVELLHLLKNNNIDFETSELTYISYTYLLNELVHSTKIIGNYIELLNIITYIKKELNNIPVKNKKKVTELNNEIILLLSESEDLLIFYRDLDNKIFKFDILKEIPKLIEDNSEIINQLIIDAGNTTKEKVIENCFYDLSKLGLKKDNIPSKKNKNDINTPFNIKETLVDKLIEIEKTYSNYEIIHDSIENLLFEYADIAKDKYIVGDYDSYLKYKEKIKSFRLENNILECIGKYLINTEDENISNRFNNVKEELKNLNLDNYINKIEEDYIFKKYSEPIQRK